MPQTIRYCLALDLKNDEHLIKEYERYHQAVWPEILQSIRDSGITEMEIYRYQNRLLMIMETDHHFSFEEKATADKANTKVQEWENMLWKYQQALPGSLPGEKWKLMNKIFSLTEQTAS